MFELDGIHVTEREYAAAPTPSIREQAALAYGWALLLSCATRVDLMVKSLFKAFTNAKIRYVLYCAYKGIMQESESAPRISINPDILDPEFIQAWCRGEATLEIDPNEPIEDILADLMEDLYELAQRVEDGETVEDGFDEDSYEGILLAYAKKTHPQPGVLLREVVRENPHLQSFTKVLAEKLKQGMPLVDAVAAAAHGKGPDFEAAIAGVQSRIAQGREFAQAASECPEIFHPIYLAALGEEPDTLSLSLPLLGVDDFSAV
jgi:hypothetical protein